MSDQSDRLIPLLEQMRDLLAEDVRLRQVAMEEQRAFQANAQASIDAAARKQQRSWILTILVLLFLFFGSSLIFPLLMGARSLFGMGSRSDDHALAPSRVDTSLFDGAYSLIEDRSFRSFREKTLADPDPRRREDAEKLLAWQADQYRNFTIRRGVIRSGTILTQEFSLRRATIAGSTLKGRALWHEDIGDPGDASEEDIQLRLEGNVLEFAMLDDQGTALDPVFLERLAGR